MFKFSLLLIPCLTAQVSSIISGGLLADFSIHCCDWVRRGECRANPSFMLVHCTEACQTISCISSPRYFPPAESRASQYSIAGNAYAAPRKSSFQFKERIRPWLEPVLQPLVPVHALSYPSLPFKQLTYHSERNVRPNSTPTVKSSLPETKQRNRHRIPGQIGGEGWTLQKKRPTLNYSNPWAGLQSADAKRHTLARIYSKLASTTPTSSVRNERQLVVKKNAADRYRVIQDSEKPNTFIISDSNSYGRNPPVSPSSGPTPLSHDYYCLFNLIKSGKLKIVSKLSTHSTENHSNLINESQKRVEKLPVKVNTNEVAQRFASGGIPLRFSAPFQHFAIENKQTALLLEDYSFNPFLNPYDTTTHRKA